MTEPLAQEFPSAAEYRYALVMGGRSEEEADKLTKHAWKLFQRQVRQSDASEYQTAEAYVHAMVIAGLEVPEIDQRMRVVAERIAEQRKADEGARRAQERLAQEIEREEVRTEAVFELLSKRYRLDPDEDDDVSPERLAQLRERLNLEYGPDGVPFDRYESEREAGLHGWVKCP